MRWKTIALYIALCGLLTCAVFAASAALPANPVENYRAIPERNIFGLKSPEPPAAPPQQTAPKLPKLVLTGITTILDNKRALIMGPALAEGASGEATGKSFILTEGQREDYVEVMGIDENTGTVQIRNCGVPMTLTLDRDGPKLPTTPAAGTAPSGPGSPQVAAAHTDPGAPNAPSVSAAPSMSGALPSPPPMPPGMRQLPSRGSGIPASNIISQAQNDATVQAGALPLPPTEPTIPPAPVSESPLTPEEKAVLLEITRQAESENGQSSPPIPPTGQKTPRIYPVQPPPTSPPPRPQ